MRRTKHKKLRKHGKLKRGRGAKPPQQPVFGIYECSDSQVNIELVESVMKEAMQDILKGRGSVGLTVDSDTWKNYRGLKYTFEDHESIDLGTKEYARGNPTISGIEDFGAFAEERIGL